MKRLLCLILCAPLLAVAAHAERAAGGDERFLAAREAYRNGEAVKLARSAEALRHHDLAPWAEYWSLRLGLEDSNAAAGNGAAVHEFLARNAGSYLAERLRSDWLKVLGKRGMWPEFAADYPPLLQPDAEVVCYGLQARLNGQRDASALDEARPLWFSLAELGDACQPLMAILRQEGRLSDDDVWTRLRSQLETRRLAPARVTLAFLPATERPEAKLLDVINDRAQKYLDKLSADFAASRSGREMALYALVRLARIDPQLAAAELTRRETKFSEAERAYAWSRLAWLAAQRHRPEALAWYGRGGAEPLSEDQEAWQVRAALRSLDWPAVEAAIERMSPLHATLPDWIYWRARALAAQGRGEEALLLYRSIADRPSFYGNLAAEELGLAIDVPPKAAPPSDEEMAAAARNPGLRRALALLRLDLRAEGVREWNWTMRDMDDRQLLAAAALAQRADVFDRAINAADRTLVEHDYSLRFLAPYRASVEPRARQLGIDNGWVYGLMRQESRFVTVAKSSVGAQGLMQLMPTTARWVAKKIGLAGYRPNRVGDTDINVTLGTNYLKLVLESLGNHPVLASAAYNAGPGRARQWRGEQALEAAVYIETIPFAETRDYVKKVMSNAVYYSALFEGKPQSLKSRLTPIAPRHAGEAIAETLP